MATPEEAVEYSRGDIDLQFCGRCGHAFNAAFDPELMEYGPGYEETQGYSGVFAAFDRRLAAGLIDRHGLVGKHIVEIGCGKGEFLALLCDLGGNSGTGFDPAFVPDRLPADARARVHVERRFFDDTVQLGDVDFVCCKMTLEHIERPRDLLLALRRALAAGGGETAVFFQVPDGGRVFGQGAFWDVYYEHCAYFSAASLVRLFRSCGYEVVALGRVYSGQYLTIEARAGGGLDDDGGSAHDASDSAGDVAAAHSAVSRFQKAAPERVERWRQQFREWGRAGERVVLWGGGSKAVAFVGAAGPESALDCVVDINPHRQGTYLAGSGHRIVGPEGLRDANPDRVVVMNSVYAEEVATSLRHLDTTPILMTVDGQWGTGGVDDE